MNNYNFKGLQYDNKGTKCAREYGFYPMPDLEKLLVILTIDNAQMLRINPKLLETSEGMDNQSPEVQNERAALNITQVKISSRFHLILVNQPIKRFRLEVTTFVFFFKLISENKCGEPRRSTYVSKQHFQYCKVGY